MIKSKYESVENLLWHWLVKTEFDFSHSFFEDGYLSQYRL